MSARIRFVPTDPGACPTCGGALVGGGDFSVWCPTCEWNVDPHPPAPPGRLSDWWQRRQNDLALRLAESVRGRQRLRRSGLGVRAVVLLAATLVHLLTLALLAAAVW